MTFITNKWFKFISNIFKVPLVLLVSIPSETSIFSYCNIGIVRYTRIHLKKFVNIYHFFKNRRSNNYHIKNIKCFTQGQVIVCFKLSFHEVFSVFNLFIIIYDFSLSLSFFPKFVFFCRTKN